MRKLALMQGTNHRALTASDSWNGCATLVDIFCIWGQGRDLYLYEQLLL